MTCPAVVLLALLAQSADGGPPAKDFDRELTARLLASERTAMEKMRARLAEPLAPDACARAQVFRAIYAPSFALPSVVTFELFPTQARLSLRTPSKQSPDGGIELTQVEAELAPEVSTALLARLTATRADELEDQVVTGTDGIGLMGTVCAPEKAAHHFVGWDYTPSRRLDFFRALLDQARASLPQLGSFTAERTLEYVALPGELISAELAGPPRTIRLVAISAAEAKPFRALCETVKPDEDVIIDLRNFSGAGTMFKPEFMKLDRRKGRTVWVAHPELAKHLVQFFGVNRGHFTDSLELAQKRLAR
jgi:hypothetical protein